MKIKEPLNFIIGIICAICFCVNIAKGRDAFVICISGFAAITNTMIGLSGRY